MDRLPTASTITQFPGVVQCFYRWHRLFSAPRRFFSTAYPSKIVSILYIRGDGLHLSFFHFQDLDIRLSSFLIVSSTSSHFLGIVT